jgi:hypothetical protein
MPTAADTLGGGAPASGPGTSAAVDALAGGYQSIMDQAHNLRSETKKGVESFSKRVGDAEQQRESEKTQIADRRSAMTPPVPEKPTTQPKFKPTDPLKAWGSSAMFIAMMGSLLTRTPMTTALNAAAAALTAFHKGDMEQYELSFKKWQVESTNAAKMYEYQQRAYDKAIGEVDKREAMSEKEYSDKVRTATSEARALAISFNDEKALVMIDRYGLDGLRGLNRDMTNHFDRLAMHAADIEVQQERAVLAHKLQETPEFKDALARVSKGDHAAFADIMEMMGTIDPKYSMLTAAQKAQLEIKMRHDMQTVGVGKPWLELQRLLPVVDRAAEQLRTRGSLDNQMSAYVVDAAQRILNNQAVRIGLVRLGTDHAPYIQQAQLAISRFAADGGGVLAPQSASELIGIINDYRNNLDKLKADQVVNNRDTAKRLGLDPDVVADPEYHPNPAASPVGKFPKPPEGAIADLKAHPGTAHFFDKHFGPGAAERLLHEGGAVHNAPGTFPAGE